MSQVPHVHRMAADAQCGEEKWKAIDCRKEELDGYNAVDETGEQFPREDGVLFDQLGEVIESACCAGKIFALVRGGMS